MERQGEIGERHLELLWVIADLARSDPAAVAQMYRAAQRMNLNSLGRQSDREEFLGLVCDLEGVGCVEARGGDLAASYGILSLHTTGYDIMGGPRYVLGECGPELLENG